MDSIPVIIMSSALVAGHILVLGYNTIRRIYRTFRPFKVGIYGPSMTGKTTLDQYLTVPGDIEPIPEALRTTPRVDSSGRPILAKAHRKEIRWKKERHPISNADVAGQSQFRNLWVDDMFSRKVDIVIFMVDNRFDYTSPEYSPQATQEAVASLQYLIENITRKNVSKEISRKARKHARTDYKPTIFCFMINKMDKWWSPYYHNLWDMDLQRQHPAVQPFKEQLSILRKAGVRAEVEAISAQTGMRVPQVFIKLLELL